MMAADIYSETTRTGFGSRIMNSFKGVLVGIILFVGSLALLWWNEGNLAREKAALREVKEKVVSADVQHPLSANDAKLLYLSGPIESQEELGDDELIEPGKYLILERNVEMYQWKEEKDTKTEKKMGGAEETTTTYKYDTGWHSGRIDSSNFHHSAGHENPALPISEDTWRARSSKFGAYDGSAVLEQLSADTELKLESKILLDQKKVIENGKILIQKSPGSLQPQVGDARISFKVLLPGTFSVIAQQQATSELVAYVASNGKEKFLVGAGVQSSDQLISAAESDSKLLAWILRAVGFVFMWIGLGLIVAPLPTLLDVLPFLGSIGRGFLSLITGVVAFVLSLAVIIVSMIAHNTIALILTVVSILGLFIWWIKRKGMSASMVTAAVSPAAVIPPPPPPR